MSFFVSVFKDIYERNSLGLQILGCIAKIGGVWYTEWVRLVLQPSHLFRAIPRIGQSVWIGLGGGMAEWTIAAVLKVSAPSAPLPRLIRATYAPTPQLCRRVAYGPTRSHRGVLTRQAERTHSENISLVQLFFEQV